MEETEDSRKSVFADYENEKNLERRFLDSRIIKILTNCAEDIFML